MYTTGPRAALAYSIAGALFIWFVLYVSERFIPPDVRRGVSSEPFELGCIAATVFIWMLFRAKMTAKSMLGAKTVVAIRGFQEFVRRVDADRLKRAPPDTFEKYLPYAMALGLERRWAGAFEGITQEPPAWYEGDGISIDVPFDTSVFAVSVHDMANDMRAIFFGSSSGSGSSSDSGSDGSSGGGSGGGGGDAF